MNLKNKKTTLSDDAALYSHREDVSEKEKWENMTTKERLRYFVDYYLGKIVITIIVLAVVGSIAYTMLRPRPEIMLSVAVVEDGINQPLYDDLKIKLEEAMGLNTEKQETVFDTGYYFSNGDYQSWQKFSMLNLVGDLDVTLMPKSVFEEYAPGNYFSTVSPYLSDDLSEALEPYLLEITLENDDGTEIPDSKAVYGIELSSVWIYQKVQREEPMVLVINAAPKHAENIDEFLSLLFFPDDAK
ncbi:MAG: hypothetical protein IKL28_03355 [Lachnospiraceae bacterium]|nr:hypothetical protein [Lachnospiraceae bacterium]